MPLSQAAIMMPWLRSSKRMQDQAPTSVAPNFKPRWPRAWIAAGVAAFFVGAASLYAGCQGTSKGDSPAATAPAATAEEDFTTQDEESALEQCEAKRLALLAEPEAPGTPELNAHRREILVRTKAEPVIFTRPPEFADASRPIRQFRSSIDTARYPSAILEVLLKGFRIHPEKGRATLLRDGYLYADREDLAYLFVELVRAEHLHDAAHIWIQRGDRTYHAKRTPAGSYVYEDGPHRGD